MTINKWKILTLIYFLSVIGLAIVGQYMTQVQINPSYDIDPETMTLHLPFLMMFVIFLLPPMVFLFKDTRRALNKKLNVKEIFKVDVAFLCLCIFFSFLMASRVAPVAQACFATHVVESTFSVMNQFGQGDVYKEEVTDKLMSSGYSAWVTHDLKRVKLPICKSIFDRVVKKEQTEITVHF